MLASAISKAARADDLASVRTASSPAHAESTLQELRASLDDCNAQLEVARIQRTEVSAELFKCRVSLDELKEQKAQLQTELARRLNTHREDVERIQQMQRELDKMRSSYVTKETEIIDLSTRIQELMAKVESTDHSRGLREENELLWLKINELKKSSVGPEPVEGGADETAQTDKAIADKWRSRFNVIESALAAAHAARVPPNSAPASNAALSPEDAASSMLDQILHAEDLLRRSLTTQISSVKVELRKAQDELELLAARQSQTEIKAELNQNFEQERDHKYKLELDSLRSELSAARSEAAVQRSQLTNAKHESVSLRSEAVGLQTEVMQLKTEIVRLKTQNCDMQSELLSSRAQPTVVCLTCQDRDRQAMSPSATDLASTDVSSELVETLTADLEALRDQNRSLKRELEAARAKAQKDGAELRKNVATLKLELADALENEGGAADATDEVEELRAQVDSLTKKAAKAEAARAAEAAKAATAASVAAASVAAQASSVEAGVSCSECVRLAGEVADLERKFEAEREEFKDSQSDWWRSEQALTGKVSGLQKEVAALKKGKAESKAAATATDNRVVSELQTEVEHLREEVAALEAERDRLQGELQSAVQKAHTFEAKIDELTECHEEQTHDLRESLDCLTRDLQELQASKRQLEEGREALQRQKDALEASVQTLTEKSDSAQVELDAVKQELHEAVNGPSIASLVSDMESENLTLEQQILRLKSALTRSTDAKRDANDLLEIQKQRVLEAEQHSEALKKQIVKVEEGWRAEYDVYVANYAKITRALDKANADRKTLEDEVSSLRNKVSNYAAREERKVRGAAEADAGTRKAAKPPAPSAAKSSSEPKTSTPEKLTASTKTVLTASTKTGEALKPTDPAAIVPLISIVFLSRARVVSCAAVLCFVSYCVGCLSH